MIRESNTSTTDLGPDRAAGRRSVDDSGDQLVPGREQVAVGVGRRGDRLVAEPCPDVGKRGTAGHQSGDVVWRRSWNRNGAMPSAACAFVSLRQTWV